MAEEHPEDPHETSTEPPVSDHETAVAAAVPLDDLILRILDEQTALAEQLRAVIDGQRLLGHDVTMTLALAQTLANGQTAVLDEMRAIRGQLARLDNQNLLEELRAARQALDRVPDVVMNRWADTLLAAAKAPA
jgi:hypothetical protein